MPPCLSRSMSPCPCHQCAPPPSHLCPIRPGTAAPCHVLTGNLPPSLQSTGGSVFFLHGPSFLPDVGDPVGNKINSCPQVAHIEWRETSEAFACAFYTSLCKGCSELPLTIQGVCVLAFWGSCPLYLHHKSCLWMKHCSLHFPLMKFRSPWEEENFITPQPQH